MFVLQLKAMNSLVNRWMRNLEMNADNSIIVNPAQNIEKLFNLLTWTCDTYVTKQA